MFEFDLQRFDEDTANTAAQDTSSEAAAQSETAEEKPIPEELNGLPEDIARATLNEWEAMQKSAEEPAQEQQPAQEPKPQTEESVPYARFKEKVDEANRLKALLTQYQQQAQAQQPQPPAQQQMKITPEVAQQLNNAIHEKAMQLSGLTQKEIDDLQFVDDDDIKLAQWNQSKALARDQLFTELRQVQFRQLQQRQQAQQLLAAQRAALQEYYDFTQKESETVPNFQDVQAFATNEYFEQLPPNLQRLVATSYLHAEQQTASPAELFVVQNYYQQAKAAFNARANAAKNPPQTPAQRAQQARNLPRADQLKGTSSKNDGQLSASDIEKLLAGDFTKIDPKLQRTLLGLS